MEITFSFLVSHKSVLLSVSLPLPEAVHLNRCVDVAELCLCLLNVIGSQVPRGNTEDNTVVCVRNNLY